MALARVFTNILFSNESVPEAVDLKEKMRRQRKTIWRLAQPVAKGGDGKGWEFKHRAERFRLLQARTA